MVRLMIAGTALMALAGAAGAQTTPAAPDTATAAPVPDTTTATPAPTEPNAQYKRYPLATTR